MRNKLKVANCVLMIALAYDLRIHIKNRMKYVVVVEKNHLLQNQFDYTALMVKYLADKLGQNEIEIDEFDLIALHHLM